MEEYLYKKRDESINSHEKALWSERLRAYWWLQKQCKEKGWCELCSADLPPGHRLLK